MLKKILFFAAVLAVFSGCDRGNYSSGDRVLVSKFAYDAKLTQPKRFDVVVFKFPGQPIQANVPKNYIKRLWGLPGQLLAIFFGRVFAWPPGDQAPASPPFEDKEADPNNLWQGHYTHRDDLKTEEMFNQGQFEIIRKPPEVMMALRRIVYDNDHQARDLKDFPRWNPAAGSAWKATGKQFQADASGASGKNDVDWLRYRHLMRPWFRDNISRDRKPELITDFMDYNGAVEYPDDPHQVPQGNWVGDLMLECEIKVEKPEGEFWMELSKGINRFRARFDLATGQCTLFKIFMPTGKAPEKVVELDTQATRMKGAGTFFVRFSNIDARLTVWVDRELPFGDGKSYPPPEIRSKDEEKLDEQALQARRGPTENDLEPASIGTKGAKVDISRVKLWRDTYYTLDGPQPDYRPDGKPEEVVVPPDINNDPSRREQYIRQAEVKNRFDFLYQFWSDPRKWDPIRNQRRIKSYYVQPGHYFCLGDNSPQSADSRDWGTVPERLLLGRALTVYFPLDRAGLIR